MALDIKTISALTTLDQITYGGLLEKRITGLEQSIADTSSLTTGQISQLTQLINDYAAYAIALTQSEPLSSAIQDSNQAARERLEKLINAVLGSLEKLEKTALGLNELKAKLHQLSYQSSNTAELHSEIIAAKEQLTTSSATLNFLHKEQSHIKTLLAAFFDQTIAKVINPDTQNKAAAIISDLQKLTDIEQKIAATGFIASSNKMTKADLEDALNKLEADAISGRGDMSAINKLLVDKKNYKIIAGDKNYLAQVKKINSIIISNICASLNASSSELFKKIGLDELLDSANYAKAGKCLNLRNYTNYFNQLSEYIVNAITAEASTDLCTLATEHWTTIADYSYKNGNQLVARAFVAAINNSAVNRLLFTKGEAQSYTKIAQGLSETAKDQLTKLMTIFAKDENLRKNNVDLIINSEHLKPLFKYDIENKNGAKIPFLGDYQTCILFSNESHSGTLTKISNQLIELSQHLNSIGFSKQAIDKNILNFLEIFANGLTPETNEQLALFIDQFKDTKAAANEALSKNIAFLIAIVKAIAAKNELSAVDPKIIKITDELTKSIDGNTSVNIEKEWLEIVQAKSIGMLHILSAIHAIDDSITNELINYQPLPWLEPTIKAITLIENSSKYFYENSLKIVEKNADKNFVASNIITNLSGIIDHNYLQKSIEKIQDRIITKQAELKNIPGETLTQQETVLQKQSNVSAFIKMNEALEDKPANTLNECQKNINAIAAYNKAKTLAEQDFRNLQANLPADEYKNLAEGLLKTEARLDDFILKTLETVINIDAAYSKELTHIAPAQTSDIYAIINQIKNAIQKTTDFSAFTSEYQQLIACQQHIDTKNTVDELAAIKQSLTQLLTDTALKNTMTPFLTSEIELALEQLTGEKHHTAISELLNTTIQLAETHFKNLQQQLCRQALAKSIDPKQAETLQMQLAKLKANEKSGRSSKIIYTNDAIQIQPGSSPVFGSKGHSPETTAGMTEYLDYLITTINAGHPDIKLLDELSTSDWAIQVFNHPANEALKTKFASIQGQIIHNIAHDLMAITRQDFLAITNAELLDSANWSNPDKCPNIIMASTRYNEINHYLVKDILDSSDINICREKLIRWIEIGDACYQNKNYAAAFNITNGLFSSAIKRLLEVNSDDNRVNIRTTLDETTQQKLARLEGLVKMEFNYKALRSHLDNAESAYIPPIGIFLSDLTFAAEFEKSKKDVQKTPEKLADTVGAGKVLAQMDRARRLNAAETAVASVKVQPLLSEITLTGTKTAKQYDADFYNKSKQLSPPNSAAQVYIKKNLLKFSNTNLNKLNAAQNNSIVTAKEFKELNIEQLNKDAKLLQQLLIDSGQISRLKVRALRSLYSKNHIIAMAAAFKDLHEKFNGLSTDFYKQYNLLKNQQENSAHTKLYRQLKCTLYALEQKMVHSYNYFIDELSQLLSIIKAAKSAGLLNRAIETFNTIKGNLNNHQQNINIPSESKTELAALIDQIEKTLPAASTKLDTMRINLPVVELAGNLMEQGTEHKQSTKQAMSNNTNNELIIKNPESAAKNSVTYSRHINNWIKWSSQHELADKKQRITKETGLVNHTAEITKKGDIIHIASTSKNRITRSRTTSIGIHLDLAEGKISYDNRIQSTAGKAKLNEAIDAKATANQIAKLGYHDVEIEVPAKLQDNYEKFISLLFKELQTIAEKEQRSLTVTVLTAGSKEILKRKEFNAAAKMVPTDSLFRISASDKARSKINTPDIDNEAIKLIEPVENQWRLGIKSGK